MVANLIRSESAKTPAPPPAALVPYDLIELLFFAYRDFVGDPDRILADYGFGRAHHRVLHFVQRRPGLTIAELLDILQITKQSLNRVLKELVEKGYIEQRTGRQDKRQRQVFLDRGDATRAQKAGEAGSGRIGRVQLCHRRDDGEHAARGRGHGTWWVGSADYPDRRPATWQCGQCHRRMACAGGLSAAQPWAASPLLACASVSWASRRARLTRYIV